ncbi:hypothetical protein ACFX2A_045920 [Malus domestica]
MELAQHQNSVAPGNKKRQEKAIRNPDELSWKRDLKGDVVLASFESRCEDFREWIGLIAFDAPWPGLEGLVAEENVAIV